MHSLSGEFQNYEARSLRFKAKTKRTACKSGALWQNPISRK
jgi:hypothetical protein